MKGPKKKKPTRRDFIELAIILVVFAVIYLTGSQAKVFGKVQQAVLYTGIMNARELDEMAIKEAPKIVSGLVVKISIKLDEFSI